jgi:hypothetical protein
MENLEELGCFGLIFVILMAIALFIFGPLVTIWALNLLFGLTIPMNLATWFATVWLSGAISRFARTIRNETSQQK